MEVYIGIPAYNAQKTIKDVVERIQKNVKARIVIVNDGSSDNTGKIIRTLKGIKIIQHSKNRGYGKAQKTLYGNFLKIAKNDDDIMVLVHADGQTLPEELPIILKPFYKNKADVVLGSRALGLKKLSDGVDYSFLPKCREMPLYKKVGDKFLTFIQNIGFGMNLTTFSSGYRAFTKRALKKINFERCSNDHVFDTQILIEIRKSKLKTSEVPIFPFYSDEISHFSLMRYCVDVLIMVLKYRLLSKY